jgi:hypothetical protein
MRSNETNEPKIAIQETGSGGSSGLDLRKEALHAFSSSKGANSSLLVIGSIVWWRRWINQKSTLGSKVILSLVLVVFFLGLVIGWILCKNYPNLLDGFKLKRITTPDVQGVPRLEFEKDEPTITVFSDNHEKI